MRCVTSIGLRIQRIFITNMKLRPACFNFRLDWASQFSKSPFALLRKVHFLTRKIFCRKSNICSLSNWNKAISKHKMDLFLILFYYFKRKTEWKCRSKVKKRQKIRNKIKIKYQLMRKSVYFPVSNENSFPLSNKTCLATSPFWFLLMALR